MNPSLSEWPFLSALALDLPFTAAVVMERLLAGTHLEVFARTESSVQPALGIIMPDLPEVGRVGLCIFPSPAVEILPGTRKGNVRYPPSWQVPEASSVLSEEMHLVNFFPSWWVVG